MSDIKSKMPDFKELSSMASKLYQGIKSGVEEIIKDYKEKRVSSEEEAKETPEPRPAENSGEKPVTKESVDKT